MRRAVRLVVIFALVLAFFVASMTLVYMVPQDRIRRNVRISLKTLLAEGKRPRIMIDHPAYSLDNSTDALMLDTAISKRRRNPLFLAMANERTSVTSESLAAGVAVPTGPVDADTILSLQQTVEGKRAPTIFYAYYWQGYQVFLRLALLLFPYATIRYLLMLSLGIAAFLTLLAVQSKAGTVAAAGLFLAMLFTGVYTVPLSLTFSTVYFVLFGSVLAVLAFDSYGNLERYDLELFLVIGMLAAFFDLLTGPLITFGVPVAVALIVRSQRQTPPPFGEQFRLFVRTGVAWLFGCAGAWFMKWVLGSVVLHRNVIAEGTAQFLFRVGARQGTLIPTALVGNFMGLFPLINMYNGAVVRPTADALTVVLVSSAVVIAAFVFLLVRFRQPAEKVRRALPVLLVAPVPYLWYIVASNHSAIHYGITYRLQAMSLFAVMYVVFASIDWERFAAAVVPRGSKRPDSSA